jgi:hypothetical protein
LASTGVLVKQLVVAGTNVVLSVRNGCGMSCQTAEALRTMGMVAMSAVVGKGPVDRFWA